MDIKSFLYQKKESRTKAVWQTVIGIIILAFLAGIILLNKNDSVKYVEHFIWEKVSVLGEISVDNNYPTNTHKLSNSIESFWLKESSINLNNFLNTEVQIDWSISEITDKYPILVISKLKIPSYKLSVSNNRFFYADKLISFDFSKDIDVYSKKDLWWIVIYYQDAPILYVDTFICSKITDTQDCEKMKHSFIINPTETFQSTQWYTFYRHKENSWIAFNDDNIWYIFTANTDNDMLNLSHLIYIVDSNFIINNKKDFILSGCSNSDVTMAKISQLSKWILDDDLIKLNINWIDTSWNKLLCKLNINMFNDWEIINATVNFE